MLLRQNSSAATQEQHELKRVKKERLCLIDTEENLAVHQGLVHADTSMLSQDMEAPKACELLRNQQS